MSQHLLATDRLAHGEGSQLLHQGYPLGPHAIVVALNKGLGIGIVQGFDGLTVAAAVIAPLTALAAFEDQPRTRATAAALLVGLPYLVASYFAQGAFKEVIQALLVLAFVLALRESTRSWRAAPAEIRPSRAPRDRQRLRLQLPRPDLAGGDPGGVAGSRTHAPRSPAASRRPRLPRSARSPSWAG